MDSIKKLIALQRTVEYPVDSPDYKDLSELFFPNYSVIRVYDKTENDVPTIIKDKVDNDILEKERARRNIIEYDISRISSRNAKKGTQGPYKTGELRAIIQSLGMGKSNGTKKDLVSTIRTFHTSRT